MAGLEGALSPTALLPQTSFGRYHILGQLGAGGTGIVLAAYDPILDRRVAIKILRTDTPARDSKVIEHTVRIARDGQSRALARGQLLAEARALLEHGHLRVRHLALDVNHGQFSGMILLLVRQRSAAPARPLGRPRRTRDRRACRPT